MAFDFPATPTTGQSVTMPDGTVRIWDGTKWVAGGSAGANAFLPLAGGTMTGPLALAADPAGSMNPVTLQYYNAHLPSVSGLVPFTGGTMTGPLNLRGVNDGSVPAAGVVGEFLSAVQSTNVSMTTATSINIVTLSLTAGDWDVSGVVGFNGSAAATVYQAGLNQTSATLPTPVAGFPLQQSRYTSTAGVVTFNLSGGRFNMSATQNVYLVGNVTFASGTMTATGWLSARRRR